MPPLIRGAGLRASDPPSTHGFTTGGPSTNGQSILNKPTDEQILAAIEKHGGYKPAARALQEEGFQTSERTIRRVAKRIGVKTTHYALPEGHALYGGTIHTDADGSVKEQWIKFKPTQASIVDAIKEAFDTYKGRAELIEPPPFVDDDSLSVYPIADQHNGLRSWGKETGENYDLAIGANRLRKTSQRLIAQSPPSATALILNLGDWTHNDNNTNQTPANRHILDVDGRYFKIMSVSVQLMMDVIELALQKHRHVIVRNLAGNHDPHTSVALTISLLAFYAQNPRVTIDFDSDPRRVMDDYDPSEFFFYRFGQTLIGANHGHRMKPEKMAMSMAVRRREDWGQTKFHYFYFGHIHHETVKEVMDVRVESFQTLAAKDAYAYNSGYNAGQSLTSITIHREDGEIGRHRVNI